MRPIRLICLICPLLFFACSGADDTQLGTIMFTANADCDIRLFYSQGSQLARVQYEVGKAPAVVNMKSSGVFVVHAVSSDKTVKEPITYVNGNLDHYIEF